MKTEHKYKVLLASGLLSIILGILLLIIMIASRRFSLIYSKAALLLIAGGAILYAGFTKIQKAWAVFLGLFSVSCSLLFLLIDSGILSHKLYQLWPFVVILSGLMLIPAGLYRYKRIVAVFFIPALVLLCMGGFFLLFSLSIIKVPFRVFAATWWPVLFIFVGIALVCLFCYMQRTRCVVLENGEEPDDYDEDIP